MKFDAETIAAATGGRVVRAGGAGPVGTDSRKVSEGSWFLALKGERFDGHAYVAGAIETGAIGAIVDHEVEAARGQVVVADTTRALQDLGRYARSRFAGPVVGLTGSSGKTTTRALTSLALEPLGPVHQTVGNLNNHLGVPMTLIAQEAEARTMVVEMGTSSPGEIAFLAQLGTPDIRVIVNVGPAHLEELGGLDGVAIEKGALFRTARPGDTAVVNLDDPRVAAMTLPGGVRRITVGSVEGADVRVTSVRIDPLKLATVVVFDTPEGELTATLPALGDHFAIDAALALGAAWAAGANLAESARCLERYAPVGMRMRVVEFAPRIRVFNDAYNANPASMLASLNAFATLDGRKVAVLGDMLELGAGEDAFHRASVAAADALGLDLLVLVGERMGRASTAARLTEVWSSNDQAALGRRLSSWLGEGDQVLVKGSRGARTEAVIENLTLPTAQEVS